MPGYLFMVLKRPKKLLASISSTTIRQLFTRFRKAVQLTFYVDGDDDGDGGGLVDALVDDLDGVAAVVLVVDDDLLEVDDDEPGVALPDPGAQRLSPYPLDCADQNLELPTSKQIAAKTLLFRGEIIVQITRLCLR